MKWEDLQILIRARDVVEKELQNPAIDIKYRAKCANLYNALRKFSYWVTVKRGVEESRT